jgi:hypothetical protein
VTLRALALALLLLSPLQAGAARRFALVVGNDRGGEGTRPLRYAEDDARRMFDILVRLGGVLPEDAQLLLGKDAPALWKAVDRLEQRGREAQSQHEPAVLFVYFSGHAKDGALRMNDSQAPLADLRQRLVQSQIEVRVAVIDACRSGVLVRTKGAHLAPAFEVDDAQKQGAHGLVVLTSSAGDEDSQESDALQGSIFTHHLASGLLGSADRSGDGRVTLSEAYAYAYARTVAGTANTASGVQHPTYDYELRGNGDLVITDVAARTEGLMVPGAAPDGTYWIVDDQGAIAAELEKRGGVDRRIALAPGAYVVTRRLSDHLRLGQLHVRSGALSVLDEPTLKDAAFADDPVKGAVEDVRARLTTRPVLGVGLGYSSFVVQPQAGMFASAPLLQLRLDLDHAMSDHFGLGFALWFGGSQSALAIGQGTLPFSYGQFGATADVLYDVWPRDDWRPVVGGRMAWMLMTRTFQDPSLPKQIYSTFAPGALLGLRRELWDHLIVSADLVGHYGVYTLSTTSRSLVNVELDLRLAWGF